MPLRPAPLDAPCCGRPLPLLLLRIALLLAALLRAGAPGSAWAQSYDPPAGASASATGAGATLKQQLNDIIDGHDSNSYDNARQSLGHTDADPNNANNLLTVYDRTSINKTWDTSPLIWNREHTWPQSRGTSSGMGHSDLFNLRPALVSNNGDRGNLNYGGAFGANGGQPGLVTDGGSFYYPGNIEAGVVARQAFYMDVRYDGSDFADLQLVAGNPAANQNQMGNLTRLLEYHYAAPPVAFELRRNQVIFSDGVAADYDQENRNPFIDRPEFAWSVFVNQANDSRIAIQGAPVNADGSTSTTLDLGRRLVGAALPAAQAVTLNKSGLNGTYYQVTATGSASSSLNGRLNAFRTNQTDAKSFTVGLAAGTSTATAGLKSGTVVVDNLDITTGGGAGRGANDANDVIQVNLSVLSHANASFAAGSDVNSLNFDFGTVTAGAPVPTASFDLFNLSATAGFTAGLDLDSIVAAGDAARLTTDLQAFSGAATLAAGASRTFTAAFDTSMVGSFTASYTLNFSDENLVGATSLAGLTLTLSGVVEAAALADSGDFNGDGTVDGADFALWQRGLGLTGTAQRSDGDANNDRTVDALDLGVWRTQFGATAPGGAMPVPEPAAAILLLAAVAALARFRAVL
ncbi:MAG TPA: endonuclease [Lacipirellulaceae bacterium]|nr:endonuclease [Lacipirellulaceae bacterium]